MRRFLCTAGPAKKKLGIQQKKKAMKSKSETYKIYSELSASRPAACFGFAHLWPTIARSIMVSLSKPSTC